MIQLKNKWKGGCMAILLTLLPLQTFSINELTPIYMFGFASSFNDSIVYITEIQQIDSAWIDSRTKFLYGRNSFSEQLSDHLTASGSPNMTCMVKFAKTRKDIEKNFIKLTKRYLEKGSYQVKRIDENTFKFVNVIPDSPEITYTREQIKAAKKEESMLIKQKKKETKKKAKADRKTKEAAKKKAMIEAKERARQLKKEKK